MSECRYNYRRNGLKEMRWNRIKLTSSRMKTSASESEEKDVNECMLCLTDCAVENCALMVLILLKKNLAKLSAVRVVRIM